MPTAPLMRAGSPRDPPRSGRPAKPDSSPVRVSGSRDGYESNCAGIRSRRPTRCVVLVVMIAIIVAAIWAGGVIVVLALCAAAGRAEELAQPGVGRPSHGAPRDRRREARPSSRERRSPHRAWIDVTG